MMIEKILYASDLSAYTPYVLQHVVELSDRYDAKIYIVHAVEPLSFMAGAVVNTYLPVETRQELESGGLDRIVSGIKQQIVESITEDIVDGDDGLSNISDVCVVRGKPVDVILQEAVRLNVDMIVMGSHGHDSVSPHMLGSVTSKILQLAKVPVYMIPLMRNTLSKAS